jgi:hypothetical protein
MIYWDFVARLERDTDPLGERESAVRRPKAGRAWAWPNRHRRFQFCCRLPIMKLGQLTD